jgi:hypothetical protein
MQMLTECKVLKDGDCFYESCWNRTLKMAYRSMLVLKLFYKWLYYRKKIADVAWHDVSWYCRDSFVRCALSNFIAEER